MSSSIIVYAVEMIYLQSVPGAADDKILSSIIKGNEDMLDIVDEQTEEFVADGELSRVLAARDALRNIVYGEPLDPLDALVYAAVYEMICAKLSVGYFEDWVQFPRAAQAVTEMQDAFASYGAAIDLLQLIYGGSPIDIPCPEDGIGFGFWDRRTLKRNARTLARLTGKRRWFRKPLDDATRESASNILGWVRGACANPDAGLVGFYHA